MAKRLRGLMLFAAGLTTGLVSLSVLRPVPQAPAPESPAEAALDRVIDEVHFQGTSLATVLAELEAKSGVKMSPGWDDTNGPPLGGHVVMHRRGMTLYAILREALDQFETYAKVWIEPNGSEVRLMTRTDPRFDLRTRVYNVRDLLDSAESDSRQLGEILNVYIRQSEWDPRMFPQDAHRYAGRNFIVTAPWEVHRRVGLILHEVRHPNTPTADLRNPTPTYTWETDRQAWQSSDPRNIEFALDRTIPPMRLIGVTLERALERWTKETELSIRIDRRELDRLGFDWKQQMDLDLPAGSAGDALESLLARYWLLRDDWLGLNVENGALVVTSRRLSEAGYVRSYDLRDWPPYRGLADAAGDPYAAACLMAGYVTASVAYPTWRQNGGTATILDHQGVLLVSQSITGHRAVRKFLATLRTLDEVMPHVKAMRQSSEENQMLVPPGSTPYPAGDLPAGRDSR